jgi:hypothetical protein
VVAPFWRWSNGKRNVVSIKELTNSLQPRPSCSFPNQSLGNATRRGGWPPLGYGGIKRVIKKVLIKFDIIKLEVRINEILI